MINILDKLPIIKKVVVDVLRSKENVNQLSVDVINEHDPDNCLSRTDHLISLDLDPGVSPYSSEGFAENVDKQHELADFIFERFLKGKQGAFLDVGFGSNIHVSNQMANNRVESYAVDQISEGNGIGDIWDSPNLVRTNSEKVNICRGDVARIGENDSYLRDKKFGLVLFNGSWNSSGNNWTVSGEVMEARYHTQSSKDVSMVQYMDKQKDNILGGGVEQLTEHGVVGIVSSRYAFHGAGFDFLHLPEEKMGFIDVIERLNRAGALKFTMVGMTDEGLRSVVDTSLNALVVRNPLGDVDKTTVAGVVDTLGDTSLLPIEDIYSSYGDDEKYQLKRNRLVKQFVLDHPELQKLSRIDAIFAEF